MVDDGEEIAGRLVIHRNELLLQRRDPGALDAKLGLAFLRRLEDRPHEVLAHKRGELTQERCCKPHVFVGCQPEAQPELGVVLEQRVRPGRPTPFAVHRPGRNREVAAVNRGTASGVGDLQPVAEQLRENLQIRRLATAGTSPGEFEQRLQELHAPDVGEVDAGAIIDWQGLEEGDVAPLRLQNRRFLGDIDRLFARLADALRRTDLHADPAAGAVFQIDLKGEADLGIAAGIDGRVLEAGRRCFARLLMEILGADHAVRTGKTALAALDAQVRIPHRHGLGDIALFEGRRARRKRAVGGQLTDWDFVASALHHPGGDVAHEGWRPLRHSRRPLEGARHGGGNLHRVQVGQRLIHCGKIGAHQIGALGPVAYLDGVFDPPDRVLARQHAGNREEAGLQDGVDPLAEPHRARHLRGVDHEEAELLFQDLRLHRTGQVIPDGIRSMGRVQQEGPALGGQPRDVEPIEKACMMAGDVRSSVRRTCGNRRRNSLAHTSPGLRR